MSEGDRQASVGVRELRQNLSVYLDRVKRGETLTVTEHGRAVGRLGPIAPSRLDELIATGRATPARGSIGDLPPPATLPVGAPTLSDALGDMRDEERW